MVYNASLVCLWQDYHDHMNITAVLNVYKADALRTNSDYM